MLFDHRESRNIMRNVQRRLKTYGRKMSYDLLPTEQQDFQEYLKGLPTNMRKYDRKTKMYIPKMPRNISADKKENYLLELNGYLNETTSFKELSQVASRVNSRSFSADELIDIKNTAKMNEFSFYDESKKRHVMRALTRYTKDLSVIDRESILKDFYNEYVLNGKGTDEELNNVTVNSMLSGIYDAIIRDEFTIKNTYDAFKKLNDTYTNPFAMRNL